MKSTADPTTSEAPAECGDRLATASAGGSGRALLRRRVLGLLACLVVVTVGWGLVRLWSMHRGIDRARRAIGKREWRTARESLDSYFRLYPHDAEAHLLMAEAWIRDDAGDRETHIQQGLQHLQGVKSESPVGARARLQEGRLTLIFRLQPSRAEELLKESLRLDPDSYEANLLMWKLLDLTGRHIDSRDYFWRVYESSPRRERALRLRDWYISEFFPDLANLEFAQAMGAGPVGTIPAWVNLLVQFREREPATPCVHAALANYYLDAGNRKAALDLLKEAPSLSLAMQDPHYVSALFETLVDLGEFDRAETCFHSWPEPRSGYLYWRSEGMYLQDVRKQPQAAIESYRKALETWPAKYDWHMMMNLAECLRKTGSPDEARALQSRVDYLTEKYLTRESIRSMREAIANLQNVEAVTAMRDMFREFGLTREADGWDQHRRDILGLSAAADRE
jgi:tetratricopeptide (TPR) repeat protein